MSSETPQPPKSRQLEQAGASDESITDVHSALLREKKEPSEGFAPLPIALLFLFSTLIFGAAVYLGRFAGEFEPLVYNENFHPSKAKAGASGAVAQVDPIALGKKLFLANCAQCHQPTGLGIAGTYPPLAGAELVLGDEKVLARILLHGLTGPIVVKGNTYNGAMPAFGPSGSNWKDEQIAAVMTYIRQEWGNTAPAVAKETVAEVRAATGGRGKAWTEAELKALAAAP